MTDDDRTVIEIGNAEQFLEFAENCRIDSWSRDKYIKLTDNINLTGVSEFTVPVFDGLFDGCGYAISGLNLTEEGSDCGLFRYVQRNGRITGLTVSGNMSAKGSAGCVGMIAGRNYGVIDDCFVKGRVAGEENVGGIAGLNAATGEIRNCGSSCVITGTHSAGGIAGSNEGIIISCENEGFINTTVSDTTIDVTDITVEDIAKIGSTASLSAFTDVGGIAGICTEGIISSINRATIGYEHVGYNIGGVTGRLSQGYVSDCENYGEIHGRKDVGGIAGQMEPFLQVEYMKDGISQLDAETNKLFDMIDSSIDDLDYYNNRISELVREISDRLKAANNISFDLPDVDMGSASISKPDIDYSKYKDDVQNTDYSKIEDNIQNTDYSQLEENAKNKAEEIANGVRDTDYSQLEDDARNKAEDYYNNGVAEAGNIAAQIAAMSDKMLSLKENFEVIAECSGKLSDILQRGNSTLTADMREISAQARKVRNIANGMTDNISSYEGIRITDGSDEDDTEENPEDAKEDVTENDTDDATEKQEDEDADIALEENYGRLVGCRNFSAVKADSAVGGIVGRIATEYDFDPEDDVELNGDQSLYMNATAKAIVRDCSNYGVITSKKDYVGGIVGYAKYGNIYSDISVSDITSESGIYAGGIAGECDSEINKCDSCGKISAKSFVGGIAGKGNNISGCRAYADIEYTSEKAGSIAGSLTESAELADNYFAESDIGGVDGVAFAKGAYPLAYEEFSKLPGLPEEFTEFTVVFVADGKEIGRVKAGYGESIKESDIPQIPEKEGTYAVWDRGDLSCITGNLTVTAVYERYLGSVVSAETTEEDGKQIPVLMVVGDFLPGAVLEYEHAGDEYEFSIVYPEEAELARNMGKTGHTGAVEVRLACGDPDNTKIYTGVDGKLTRQDTEKIGSYISFKMDNSGRFKAVTEKDYTLFITIGIIVFVIIAVVVIVVMIKRLKKLKKKLALKRAPKAVIFDLDGTLIDTERFYRKVWPQAAEHFGYIMSDEQVLQLRSLGRPFAPKKLKEWFGEDFNYDVVRTYRKRLFEQCVSSEGIKLKPGVIELLNFLKGRGITIAVATATDVERTERYLKAAGIYEYFDRICSAADVKEGKPAPYVYEEACRQLKLKPWECFAVEDAPNGIKSAAAAGCRVIFIPDQTSDEPEAEKFCFAKVKTADEIKGFFN